MASNAGDVSVKIEEEAPTLSTASILGLDGTTELPQTVAEFKKFRFHDKQPPGRDPAYFIAFITQRLIRTQMELEIEFPGAQQAVYNIILAINLLQKSNNLSLLDEKSLNIRFILNSIMGDSPLAKGPFSFPQVLQDSASVVLGAINKRLPPIEETSLEAPRPATTSPSPPRTQTRHRTNYQPQLPLPNLTQDLTATLRGLMLAESGRRTYHLADKTMARDCNVVGDNGITIGTWWPYRICALRDGAHGASMAGIAGSVYDGAYSIVVSGMYADLDKDDGETLYYSGSKAHDNVDTQNPIISKSTRALQTSKREDRSVRVLRAAGGDSRYAPSCGLRYDGLYKIVEELLPLNRKGGRYVRFTLVRNPGQPAIDLTRPNAQERAIFNRLREL